MTAGPWLASRLRRWLMLACVCLAASVATGSPVQPALPALIPQPVDLRGAPGSLLLDERAALRFADPSLAETAALLADYATGFGLSLAPAAGDGTPRGGVALALDPSLAANAYRLRIDPAGVALAGGSAAAVFHGVQSLRQILFQASPEGRGRRLPALTITDAPAFRWRGMHLDVSRHFFDLDFIKRYIDLLALHRMNVFHWHLTDDQGWRIEIAAYPKLTGVGGRRAGTVIGHSHDADARSDGHAYGGYYSREEVREVVAYAASRHVLVVPEIDVPGHASAMIAAYPELGCSGEAARVQTHFGVFPEVLCPRDATFAFLAKVFEEVAELFPGPYIHIGGDEVVGEQWLACAECRELMAREGLPDKAALHAWFVNRVEGIVNGLGKRIIGWDEILDGEIRPSATVMSWRGMEGGLRGARLGHEVIMTPLAHVYFDFYQSDSLDEPMAIHGLTRLRDVYRFRPVPPDLSPAERARILGGQGNLWTEYVRDAESAERMVLPRMSALAEVLWTPEAALSYPDFMARLPRLEQQLRSLDYTVADSHYKPHIAAQPLAGGGFRVTMDTAGGDILYTLDGSAPGEQAARYRGPLELTHSATVRAATLRADGSVLGNARMTLLQHRARGARITPTAASDPGWDADSGRRLVDGLVGHDRIFRYPHWVGFGEEGMDLVLDLGGVSPVSEVAIGVDAGLHRRLHRPTSFRVLAPAPGGQWRELASMSGPDIEAAGAVLRLGFPPQQLDRLRVVAGNDRRSWSEEQGAQVPVTLRIDEIMVN